MVSSLIPGEPEAAERSHDTINPTAQLQEHLEDTMARTTGTIKRLVKDKGFGFIADGSGSEYFFHQSACTETRFDDMREGQTVSFDIGQGPKGPRAENVRPE